MASNSGQSDHGKSERAGLVSGVPPLSQTTSSPSATSARRNRIPLGARRNRISYERRIRIWMAALALPSILLIAALTYIHSDSLGLTLVAAFALIAIWSLAAAYFFEQLTRPLQTLSNVVAALREDDFSFRARGARRNDSLGDLALEINALAGTLQHQRTAARDALTLVERVMTSMQSPVLAFDAAGRLRLINPAAEQAFHLPRQTAMGRFAADLDIAALLNIEDQGLYTGAFSAGLSESNRWSVRRTNFRLHGVPHTLLVFSDVAAALREEERLAWQRLIRVLSHEINNSLTPIKSLAGSLRSRLPELARAGQTADDFQRGLTVIEERAAALNNFLQAYQQLTRLPPPQPRRIDLRQLLEHVVSLEARLPIKLENGPTIHLLADPDQLQQSLINLVRNAVEAALSVDASTNPVVAITWFLTPSHVAVQIRDNGPGLTNPANLFVPFYTTKAEGSGIGLVLAQQIAAAHKGSVTLSNNQEGTGCTAELRLPVESFSP